MIYLGTAQLTDAHDYRYQVHAGIRWHSLAGFTGTLGGDIDWTRLAECRLAVELPSGAEYWVGPVTADIVIDTIVDNEVTVRGCIRPAGQPRRHCHRFTHRNRATLPAADRW